LWQAAEFGEHADERMQAYRRFILELYHATPVTGYSWLHGVKAGRTVHVGAVVTGFAVAALVGVLALKLLVRSVRRANLKFFAFYCYILGCFLLVYLLKST